MKKLFFTAVALIAFSGSAMAENVEVKTTAFSTSLGTCDSAYDRAFRDTINGGGTFDQATKAAKAARAKCEEDKKKSTSIGS